jgi:hypothetical protein
MVVRPVTADLPDGVVDDIAGEDPALSPVHDRGSAGGPGRSCAAADERAARAIRDADGAVCRAAAPGVHALAAVAADDAVPPIAHRAWQCSRGAGGGDLSVASRVHQSVRDVSAAGQSIPQVGWSPISADQTSISTTDVTTTHASAASDALHARGQDRLALRSLQARWCRGRLAP